MAGWSARRFRLIECYGHSDHSDRSAALEWLDSLRGKLVTSLNVAEAKKHFSDLLGRVAYGGETIVITRHGRPVAKLAPLSAAEPHLAEVRGWLEDDDPFFAEVDQIVAARSRHVARVLRKSVGASQVRRRR